MKLSKHSDYALRVLMYLAVKPDQKHTVKDISSDFDISKNHLMKITAKLVNYGYIEASRGRVGGLKLAKPAKAIKIGAVVEKMESSMNLVECIDCKITRVCKLKEVLAESSRAFIHALDNYSLGDLVVNDKQIIEEFR